MHSLQAWLRDADGSVREAAYQGLAALAPSLTEAQVLAVLQNLQMGLKDEYSSVRKAAYQGLAALAPRLPVAQVLAVLQSLQAVFKDADKSVREAAYQGLAALVSKVSEAKIIAVIHTLQAWLKDADGSVQEAAYQRLAALVSKVPEAKIIAVIHTLQAWLKDADGSVREAAYQRLAALAPRLPEAQVLAVLQSLQAGLNDTESHVRKAAYRVVVALAPRLPEAQVIAVIQTLQAGLKHAGSIREAASKELAALAPRLTEAQVIAVIQTLQEGLKDNNWEIQNAGRQGLITLVQSVAAAQVSNVIEKLLPLLNDKNVDVRAFVLENLAKVYSPRIQLQLLKRAIIKSYVMAQLETLAEQLFDPLIQQKIFSFLDPDTLSKIIPCINKDWQRWQQGYLQQQGELLREKKGSILKAMPPDDRENLQTGFQHFLKPDKVRVATGSVQIKPKAPQAVQTKLTASLKVASKQVNLAQTDFFVKPTLIPLAKLYMVKIDQQMAAFEVQAVAGDGECGYTAFGIARAKAYELLLDNLDAIRPFIKPALQEAIRTEAFIHALRSKGHLTQSLSTAYANYIQASQGVKMPQSVLDALDRAGEDLTIVRAYIEYDVRDKHIDAGWLHPSILFALAEIKKSELHLWQANGEELIPHSYYPQHIPAQATQRIDLLFVNGNHFERLELIKAAELVSEVSHTNVFKSL